MDGDGIFALERCAAHDYGTANGWRATARGQETEVSAVERPQSAPFPIGAEGLDESALALRHQNRSAMGRCTRERAETSSIYGPSLCHDDDKVWIVQAYRPPRTPGQSAAAIGRVAPGRDQQGHVEMAFRLAGCEAERDPIVERRIRERHLFAGEVGRHGKIQFVAADRNRTAADQ